mmetsp:Transcript_6806/g.9937  ORF Transcript_6806/g.9937 Transcript_6806/m.9937 type:complete len:263 (+) Transcript_6806:122-910(+)
MSKDPLAFCMPGGKEDDDFKIRLHETDENSDDEDEYHHTGFVMWPSAVMLSRYITQNPSILSEGEGDILEIGAGCGLVGLTAAALLNKQQTTNEGQNGTVIITDYDPAVIENIERNIRLNDLEGADGVGLDFFDQKPEDENNVWIDTKGVHRPQVNLILGADLMAYSNDASLVANTIHCALSEGGKALIYGPNKSYRFGVGDFPEACHELGLLVQEKDYDPMSSISSQLLIEELEQSGYDKDRNGAHHYDFTMFTVTKPTTA